MKPKYERALLLATSSGRRTKEIYDLLVAAHTAGDARATYALATWYLHGTRYTKRNIPRGTDMLKDAVAANIADAAHDLAVSYEKGVGVKKTTTQAFRLYMRAALLGDKQSIYEVGRMYYYGIGTKKNQALAEIWLDCAEHFGITD